ncbi:C14 family peptidase [Mesorhizobium sp. LNJC384A00]|uniref:caspase family protein n=1 Tax=Mesorhizobium sp. LNJC384A00 TaxID=1287268 RepID=UPI0003CF3E68|nr:caspase family protein [Mesorhizobium sp. LNJC384A00]ESY35255.1 C14 family peptidase [Mesorhizobium sp. LNJC384A00]
MATGRAIHIGLNAVSSDHYSGWSGELTACEFDANDMELLAEAQGFETSKLLTSDATRQNFESAMEEASGSLVDGDFCLITYSGHGGVLPDLNADEDDGQDETWCLFDGQLVDDELYNLLAQFRSGVRVAVLSDSCHSGTVLKDQMLAEESPSLSEVRTGSLLGSARAARVRWASHFAYRAMPSPVAARVYMANKREYDKILTNKELGGAQERVVASCLLISGCQDNQLSGDGTFNGVFTARLKSVWNGGKFKGDYRSFVKTIVHGMPADQTPNLFAVGTETTAFASQSPFVV